MKRGGYTLSLWGDIDDPNAPHAHFVKSFAQRSTADRRRLCCGKTDVDVYNDKRKPTQPIQIPLDFTLDVEDCSKLLARRNPSLWVPTRNASAKTFCHCR